VDALGTSEKRTKVFFNVPLGECSDQSVYLAAVLEEKQRGNALNSILGSATTA